MRSRQWPMRRRRAVTDHARSTMATEPEESSPLPITAVDVRNGALVVLAVLATLFALHAAREVFVPVMLGVVFSYALTPLVNRLVQWHVPRSLAAALVLGVIVGGVGTLAYSLSDDAVDLVDALPQAAQKLRRSIEGRLQRSANDTIESVQKAAAELERVAAQQGAPAKPERGVTRVQIEQPRFDIKDHLWSGARGVAVAVAQALVVLFVAYALLASGDTFRRKMVKVAGPNFGQKRLTLQALDEIDAQIQRYLLVQVLTSVLVGVLTGLAFLWLGVHNAAAWGLIAFGLNFIPYFGGITVTVASALLGFLQFGSIEMALLVGGTALLITGLEGYFLTPWLTGKANHMNFVAVFVGVLAWGWLWGVWGMLLGVPILLAVKAVCDRIDDFKPVGELLGE
jgi:predicted PurR-regulated permease PerM